jgi:hypothetical protein
MQFDSHQIFYFIRQVNVNLLEHTSESSRSKRFDK